MSEAGSIRHKLALLHDIAEGVRREARYRVEVLEVAFVTTEGEFVFSLEEALLALANDTYWDERGNWSEATSAKVRTI